MSRRTERLDELLRRELAQLIFSGELNDPRLQPSAAISITGVRVTADLAQARVFIDVHEQSVELSRALLGLRAGAAILRRRLGERLRLRRVPRLSFEYDQSIARGARIEALIKEIQNVQPPPQAPNAEALASTATHDGARENGEGEADRRHADEPRR